MVRVNDRARVREIPRPRPAIFSASANGLYCNPRLHLLEAETERTLGHLRPWTIPWPMRLGFGSG